MKKILLLLVLAVCPVQAQPTAQIIDSLKKELGKNPDKLKKATLYSDLTFYYSSLSIDSALAYGNRALAYARELKNPKITSQVYSDLGSVYMAKGEYAQSKKNYLRSLSIRTKTGDKDGMASNWANIGGTYQRMNVRDTAMIYYLKALRHFEQTGNEGNADFIRNNIAVLYEDLHNIPKAIEMYKQIAAYRKKTEQDVPLAMVYNNLGNAYKKRDDRQAEHYFRMAETLSAKAGDSLLLGTTYINLGTLYNAQKKADAALRVLLPAYDIMRKVNSEADIALTEYGLAVAYSQKKEYVKSKNLYLKSIRSMIRLEANEYIPTMYLNLIPIYANLNMPDSASFYTEKYKAFQNREIEDKVAYETAELETKYQTEKKEKQLQQQQAEARRRNLMLLLVSVFAGFIALTGYLIYRQQRLKNQQQQQEHELKMAISKIETQNKLQEQRLSISRDLHDNIGAQLTFIISSVDNIKYGFNVENPSLLGKLDHISNFTKSTIVELRDTIWAMNAEAITFKDLELRIMNFIEKAKNARENIWFDFTINEHLSRAELSSIVGMNVYRTIQEAVNNAIKYAQADRISIAIGSEKGKISIVISDNGQGFDLENAAPGNGLQNMKKRIKDIGGIYEIRSEKGQGTTVSFSIDHL